LFLAGYLPGLLVGLFLMIAAAIWAKRHHLPKGERSTLRNIGQTCWNALPSLMLLLVVMGGIVSGLFTATEASAIAVVYTLALGFLYGEISIRHLHGILLQTAGTTAIVLLLIGCSMSMSWIMAYENIPQSVTAALLSVSDNKVVLLLLINLILLVVGFFMDMTPAVLIFTPILLPMITTLGMNPVHFGIMMVLNLCIGLCTPPVGSVLFVGAGIANVNIQEIIKPLMPLFLMMLLALLCITYIPQLSLWLPGIFGY
jgi:tripartite ATP-independent transporter DctM subunit